MQAISPCRVGLARVLLTPRAVTSPLSGRTITAPNGKKGLRRPSSIASRIAFSCCAAAIAGSRARAGAVPTETRAPIDASNVRFEIMAGSPSSPELFVRQHQENRDAQQRDVEAEGGWHAVPVLRLPHAEPFAADHRKACEPQQEAQPEAQHGG